MMPHGGDGTPGASPSQRKVWVRVAGKQDHEALGVRVGEGTTIAQLKEQVLHLVSFDDFPVTVGQLRAQHLNVMTSDMLLEDDDSAMNYIGSTLVVMPSAQACKTAAPTRDPPAAPSPPPARPTHQHQDPKALDPLAALWEDLPSLSTPTNALGSPAGPTYTAGFSSENLRQSPSPSESAATPPPAAKRQEAAAVVSEVATEAAASDGAGTPPPHPPVSAGEGRGPGGVGGAGVSRPMRIEESTGGETAQPSSEAQEQQPEAEAEAGGGGGAAESGGTPSRGNSPARNRTPVRSGTPVRSKVKQQGSSPASSYQASSLLKPLANPSQSHYLKALSEVQGSDWQQQCQGLTVLRRCVLHHASLLLSNLQTVLLAVTACLKSLRSAVVKNALLAFTDIVRSECRDQQAMVAQLDPIAHQILSLATSDTHFIREAADECFQAIATELCDGLRYRLISKMLASAANSKSGAVRAECVSVIHKAVHNMDGPAVQKYPKMSLLVKALHNFLADASESCRHNARDFAAELAQKVGGVKVYISLMSQYMLDKQIEDVCKHMGGEWVAETPATPPAASLSVGRLTSSMKSPRRSPKLSPKMRASSPSPARIPPTDSLHDIPPETHHTATPALSDLIPHAQRACPLFRPRWGNPAMCDNCKLSRSAHTATTEAAAVATAKQPSRSSVEQRSRSSTHRPPAKPLSLSGTLTSTVSNGSSGAGPRRRAHPRKASSRSGSANNTSPGGRNWETSSQNSQKSRGSAASRSSKVSKGSRVSGASAPLMKKAVPAAAAATGTAYSRTTSLRSREGEKAGRRSTSKPPPAVPLPKRNASSTPGVSPRPGGGGGGGGSSGPATARSASPAKLQNALKAASIRKLDEEIMREMESQGLKSTESIGHSTSPEHPNSARKHSQSPEAGPEEVLELTFQLEKAREQHKRDLAEKDAIILALVKENMELKRELERAKKEDVSHVTIFTTPQYGADGSIIGDSGSLPSSPGRYSNSCANPSADR